MKSSRYTYLQTFDFRDIGPFANTQHRESLPRNSVTKLKHREQNTVYSF